MAGWFLHIAPLVSLTMVLSTKSTALSSLRVLSRIMRRMIRRFTRVWCVCSAKCSLSASKELTFQLSSWSLRDFSRPIYLMKALGVRRGAGWRKITRSCETSHPRSLTSTQQSAKQITIKWNLCDTDLNKEFTCDVNSMFYQSKWSFSFLTWNLFLLYF